MCDHPSLLIHKYALTLLFFLRAKSTCKHLAHTHTLTYMLLSKTEKKQQRLSGHVHSAQEINRLTDWHVTHKHTRSQAPTGNRLRYFQPHFQVPAEKIIPESLLTWALSLSLCCTLIFNSSSSRNGRRNRGEDRWEVRKACCGPAPVVWGVRLSISNWTQRHSRPDTHWHEHSCRLCYKWGLCAFKCLYAGISVEGIIQNSWVLL